METLEQGDVPNATITIAPGDDPTEGGTGTFRISRTGGTLGDLPVNYTIGDTATPTTDYTALSGSATIPDGSDYVDVSMPTVVDNLVEGDETVIMTITDGGTAYTATPPASEPRRREGLMESPGGESDSRAQASIMIKEPGVSPVADATGSPGALCRAVPVRERRCCRDLRCHVAFRNVFRSLTLAARMKRLARGALSSRWREPPEKQPLLTPRACKERTSLAARMERLRLGFRFLPHPN